MIRSVTAIKLKAGAKREQVDDLIRAMQRVRVEGMHRLDSGGDLGLREGNWDFALTADFDDREAYLRSDRSSEHNRIRREIAEAITDAAVRVQFEIPGQPTIDGDNRPDSVTGRGA